MGITVASAKFIWFDEDGTKKKYYAPLITLRIDSTYYTKHGGQDAKLISKWNQDELWVFLKSELVDAKNLKV